MDRIDKDNNGKVTQKELEDWIKFTAKRYVYEDVDRQWDQLKKLENAHMTLEERYVEKKKADPNEAIGWELYKNLTYGYITGQFNMEILITNFKHFFVLPLGEFVGLYMAMTSCLSPGWYLPFSRTNSETCQVALLFWTCVQVQQL